ncbi:MULTISPECIES: SDR family oxidoreductase [Actinoalloteichus]|uniref:Ketoreductase domain-containing protein n=1 Tax=Actinoalloteichus fjordicus TaxID=1612552 RepID=A0AAC9LB84_9PSEU|nr:MULTISPECIES: SDR family oxidoreductase [Actinoalloteichus]APU14578.1 dehydrogenase of unknown specificity, short-chain alcohol dehydrogenase like [Actinoalloteichus fjordicus]APU20546.1 dehydrogenase of unknown specificity, short-chain alcohol dehydrogenase like [Actinoalloteichus sp. GBA129-24]
MGLSGMLRWGGRDRKRAEPGLGSTVQAASGADSSEPLTAPVEEASARRSGHRSTVGHRTAAGGRTSAGARTATGTRTPPGAKTVSNSLLLPEPAAPRADRDETTAGQSADVDPAATMTTDAENDARVAEALRRAAAGSASGGPSAPEVTSGSRAGLVASQPTTATAAGASPEIKHGTGTDVEVVGESSSGSATETAPDSDAGAAENSTADPEARPAATELGGGADHPPGPLDVHARDVAPEARVAMVTGASRGLGAAIAEALARRGLAVAINFVRDEAGAQEVRRRIGAAGGTAEIFRADVTDETQVADLCRAVRKRLGAVDVLVLNATGAQPAVKVEDLTWRDMLDQLEFFAKSPLLLVKEVIPEMRKRGHGRIVNIGSEVVELGVPESSAYVAAKAAQLGLTRSWARELAPHGITVNLVAPGWIPTERHGTVTEESGRAYLERVPVGRFGLVEEVGAAVAHLASVEAGFITGQRIAVNGGNTLA